MAKKTIQNWRGLMTSGDQLQTPEGGLAGATNVSLERDGSLQPHRGIAAHSSIATYKNTNRLWEFAGFKMAHVDDGAGTYRLHWYTGAVWTDLGTSIRHADGTTGDYKLHQVELNDWLYIVEENGLRRFTVHSAFDAFAGAPKCPDMDRSNSTMTNGGTGVIAPQKQRAYKALFEIRKPGEKPITGSPSGRMVLQNTNASGGSNQIPLVRVLIPKTVNTSATAFTGATELWCQLYASSITDDLSYAPLEDFALIYDVQISVANIAAGYVDITDTTPDLLRGQALYTNPTQEGALNANEPPPFIRCLSRYKDCLLGASTVSRGRLELQILAVGGSNGIADTDTLTIENLGGTTFTVTGKTAPAVSTDYKLEAGGALSTSQILEFTAQNLCAAINRHASNTFVYAWYAGIPDNPRSLGKIIIESRQVQGNGATFYAYVGTGDRRACFEPQLPETSLSTYVASLQDDWSNGWALSKVSQGDAWPLLNSGRLGKGNIIHVGALDDAAFFFHDSGEVWMMTGDPPIGADPGTLSVQPWRENLELLAPNTVQVMDGRLICWTTQGVVAISPEGYEKLSEDIDWTLLNVVEAQGRSIIRRNAWAVVDPLTRRYILGTKDEDNAWSQFVFHATANEGKGGWSRIQRDLSAGMYCRADDRLYYGAVQSSAPGLVRVEQYASSTTGASSDAGTDITSTVTLPPFVVNGGEVPKQLREIQVAFESTTAQPTVTATFTTELGSVVGSAVSSQGTKLCRIPVPQSMQRAARHIVSLSLASGGSTWRMSALTYLFRPYSEKATK